MYFGFKHFLIPDITVQEIDQAKTRKFMYHQQSKSGHEVLFIGFYDKLYTLVFIFSTCHNTSSTANSIVHVFLPGKRKRHRMDENGWEWMLLHFGLDFTSGSLLYVLTIHFFTFLLYLTYCVSCSCFIINATLCFASWLLLIWTSTAGSFICLRCNLMQFSRWLEWSKWTVNRLLPMR